MAMTILQECISCGACEPDCPNEAIDQGDTIYTVHFEKCTECVGAHDSPRCIEVCPIEGCIVPDPDHVESREELAAKYARMH